MASTYSSGQDIPSSPTVLIADDDAGLRRALRTRLESWGYQVVESHDGLSAIAKTVFRHVDAIVLDHEMPLGAGREIASSLRAATAAPIIFLSGHCADEFRDTVVQVSESYYLAKPLDSVRLRELLASLTEPVCI